MRTLLAALVFASPAFAQPAWLQHFPGATPQTRTSAALSESTYEVAAKPAAVIAHYQKVFESAGVGFHLTLDGIGTVVRASVPECDVLLKIRELPNGTSVRLSCAAKSPALVAVPEPKPRIAEGREHTRQVLQEAEQQDRKRLLEMEKYDKPVYPRPKASLVWPSWLVGPDGAPLDVKKTASNMTSTFLTTSDRAAIQAHYVEMLNSHGCAVTWQTQSMIECSYVRIDLIPSPKGTRVDLRVTP